MLAQYLLHNNEIFFYMRHVLYKFNKKKIVFENQCLINVKFFWPTFNYSEFYTIIHFVWCIWDYGNTIKYNMVHNKVVYKYLLKNFYEKINKKKLQVADFKV